MAASEDSDGLEFEPVAASVPVRGRGLRVLVLFVILLAAAGGAGWLYLGDRLWLDEDGKIPVIRAEAGPIKVRPESPGGMEVPDRDKLVYERLDGTEDKPLVERLLPPPEVPLAPPAPEAAPEATPEAAEEQPAPSAPLPPPESLPAVPTIEEVLAAQPPAKVLIAPETVGTENAGEQAKAAESDTGYKVQLAAVRSPEQAREEWERLRKKHPDLLEKLRLTVTRADLGADKGGVFFRLRAGPVADRAAARELCAKLKERKMGCLVVHPGG